MFKHIKRQRDRELRYSPKSKSFRSYDPDTKQTTDLPNEPMIVDFGTVRHGWELLKAGTKRDIKLVYINESLPDQPSPDHEMVGAVRVLLPSIGRATIIVDTDSMAGAFSDLHDEYSKAAEAAEGLLPVVTLNTDSTFSFSVTEWMERSEHYLGERILPPPDLNE